MQAMQMLDTPFAVQARAIMDRHDLPPQYFEGVRLSLAYKAFIEETEPWRERIIRAKSLAMPCFVIHDDGRLEHRGDGLTEPQREVVRFCEARIQEIRSKYERTMGVIGATPPAAHPPCPDSPDTA